MSLKTFFKQPFTQAFEAALSDEPDGTRCKSEDLGDLTVFAGWLFKEKHVDELAAARRKFGHRLPQVLIPLGLLEDSVGAG